MKNTKNFEKGYIYVWENIINGKVYVGQSTKPNRPYIHLKRPPNRKFKNALNKYGKDNFKLKIVCECYSQKDLNWAEAFYILEWYDSLHPSRGYNLQVEGYFNAISLMDEETYKDYIRRLTIAQNKPETKKKRSDSLKKTQGNIEWKKWRDENIYTEEYKKKLSESMKKAFENPQRRINHSEGLKKRYKDPIFMEKFKQSAKASQTPERRANLSKKLSEHYKTEEGKKTLQKRISNPEFIKSLQEGQRKRYSRIEEHIKIQESHRTPQARNKIAMIQRSEFRKKIEKCFYEFCLKNPCFIRNDVMDYFAESEEDRKQMTSLVNFLRNCITLGILERNGFRAGEWRKNYTLYKVISLNKELFDFSLK